MIPTCLLDAGLCNWVLAFPVWPGPWLLAQVEEPCSLLESLLVEFSIVVGSQPPGMGFRPYLPSTTCRPQLCPPDTDQQLGPQHFTCCWTPLRLLKPGPLSSSSLLLGPSHPFKANGHFSLHLLNLPIWAVSGPTHTFWFPLPVLTHLSWEYKYTASNFRYVKYPLIIFNPFPLVKGGLLFLFFCFFLSYSNSPHHLISHDFWCVHLFYLYLTHQEKKISGMELRRECFACC